MNTQAPAGIGHNFPPDPIDTATAPFGDLLSEVENWTDGEPVSDEDGMNAVDRLIREMKAARSALKKARDESTSPLHQAWKDEVARWKPTEDDFQMRQDCLVAIVAPFKAELAAEREAVRIAAAKAAREAEEEARRAAREAAAGDLEAQAKAKEAADDHKAATAFAAKGAKETVKGMRTVHRHEVTDMRALLGWMAKDAKGGRAALEACAAEFARKNARDRNMDGVRIWEEKEAF